jgi:hypothetical protein
LLGCYQYFAENVHAITFFEYQDSDKEIQKVILCKFHNLNQKTIDLGAVTPHLNQKTKVGFEFGVADGLNFNYLDQKELERYLKNVDKTKLEILDFFFVVKYHRVKECGKRIPLKFDYYVLRFLFQEDGVELRIRHERGTRRIPIDDLTQFLIKLINIDLSRRHLVPLFLRSSKKVDV